MNPEDPSAEKYKAREILPSKEEITSIFNGLFSRLFEGGKIGQPQAQEKEGEILSYRVDVILEDGEKMELNYQKATGNPKDLDKNPGARFSASIHIYYYDAQGEPIGGKLVANYLNGQWKYYE